jgi:large subunit ribosomal protein L14e
MIEIGRLCVKIAGRDAGKIGIIIDIIDDNYVLIDGETRRRKCNINHIELIDKMLEIKKNASEDDIITAFKEINIELKKSKDNSNKEKKERPKKQKKKKKSVEQEKTPVKKTVKIIKEATPKKDDIKKK